MAILEVALTRVNAEGVRVVNMGGGAPKVIGVRETPRKTLSELLAGPSLTRTRPAYLRKFLVKLIEVSQAAKAMAEEDDERAMREAAEGDITSEPRMDRLRERLEKGPGVHESEASQNSTDQTVTSLSNAINELSLGEFSPLSLLANTDQ